MKVSNFLDSFLAEYKLIFEGWLLYNQWIIRTIAFLLSIFHSSMLPLHITEMLFTSYPKTTLQSIISLTIMRIMNTFLEVVKISFIKKTTSKFNRELQKLEKQRLVKILNHLYHRTTYKTQKIDHLIYSLSKNTGVTLIQTSFIICFEE